MRLLSTNRIAVHQNALSIGRCREEALDLGTGARDHEKGRIIVKLINEPFHRGSGP